MAFVEIPYDVYHYDCALCNRGVKTEKIKTCIICFKRICDVCYIEGFCIEHYNMLTADGKSKLNKFVEDYNIKKKDLYRKKTIVTAIIIAFVLTSFTSFLIFATYNLFPFAVFPSMIALLFVFLFLFILDIQLVGRFNKKIMHLSERLYKDKISLFNNYVTGMEAINPKIEKKCEKCGRILKSDSEYCDKCGSII